MTNATIQKEHSEENRKQVRSNGSKTVGEGFVEPTVKMGLEEQICKTKGCAAKKVGGGENGRQGWRSRLGPIAQDPA